MVSRDNNPRPVAEIEVFPNVVMPCYREEDAVSELKQDCKAFERFYDARRAEIKNPSGKAEGGAGI